MSRPPGQLLRLLPDTSKQQVCTFFLIGFKFTFVSIMISWIIVGEPKDQSPRTKDYNPTADIPCPMPVPQAHLTAPHFKPEGQGFCLSEGVRVAGNSGALLVPLATLPTSLYLGEYGREPAKVLDGKDSSASPRRRPGETTAASSEIKALQQTRRLLANARERTRVHTISAAFEALRKQVPCYSYGQKLSKLAILRIACNYILSLARLADLDYSADHSNLSFSECVQRCTRTLQAEGRAKKRKSLLCLEEHRLSALSPAPVIGTTFEKALGQGVWAQCGSE
ncbi:Protein atonal like protein 8 [Fukomys damarensis]|uniref:Protein atonal homolog 8 n=1 Tax=Fukomys damarensis TaxID=885580 RepID=A0A091EBJ7_FUKDA|nr:Protein atonal like protein 8 [Fukomys damarensis]